MLLAKDEEPISMGDGSIGGGAAWGGVGLGIWRGRFSPILSRAFTASPVVISRASKRKNSFAIYFESALNFNFARGCVEVQKIKSAE